MKVKRPDGTRLRVPLRSTAVVVVAGLGLASVAALSATAEPVDGDGTTVNLLYSIDGSTWSDDLTVQRGQAVTARLFYDNTNESTLDGVSLTSQIPDGFSYVAGSTRNVLAPGSDVAAGTVGSETKESAVSDDVWDGDMITVSPSAGFNGESNASAEGSLRNGVYRYLNLHDCQYFDVGLGDTIRFTVDGTGTKVSNTADGSVSCGDRGGYTLQGGNVSTLDLLGNQYVNLHECQYLNAGTTDRVRFKNGFTGTNASNTADGDVSCSDAGSGFVLEGGNVLSLETLGHRYVNLHECQFLDPVLVDRVRFLAAGTGTNMANEADASASCPDRGNYVLEGGVVAALDLVDTSRGQGFVEFQFTSEVPPTPACGEVVTEPEVVSERPGAMTGDGTGDPATAARITLAEYTAEGEACDEVVLVDDESETVVDTPVDVDIDGNDTIPDGSTGWTVDDTSTEGGTVADNGDGTVTYTPPDGFVGTDTFTYHVTGPDGVEHEATVTITVVDPDDIPLADPAIVGLAGIVGLGLAGGIALRRRRTTAA